MKEKKRICIVGPSKRFLSGISYYTICLANEMSISSDISVLCFRQLLPQFLFPGKKRVGKQVSSMDFSPEVSVFDGMDYNNPLTWWKAYRFLSREKPDYIILQWWTSSVAHMHLMLKLFSTLVGIKLILEFHEVVDQLEESILPLRIYSKITGSLLRRNIKLYVSHSSSDRKLISQRYGIDESKIYVIPHGLYNQYGKLLDNKKARDKLCIREEHVILSFGLIRKYKGIPYLIKAFESLPEDIANNTRLLIVGEVWEQRDELLEMIKSSRYSNHITLVDEYVPDEQIPLYFSASDMVVLPYTRASQSGIGHIAMSYGKPVIVSKVGGLEESMANYEGTFFIPPENIEAIGEEIMNNIHNKGRYASPNLSWERIVEYYYMLVE